MDAITSPGAPEESIGELHFCQLFEETEPKPFTLPIGHSFPSFNSFSFRPDYKKMFQIKCILGIMIQCVKKENFSIYSLDTVVRK